MLWYSSFSFRYHEIELCNLLCSVNISEPLPSLDMYQTSKRGLQVLLWTDLLKGFMIALGWLLREPTTINYPFEKGPLSPVRFAIIPDQINSI